MFGMALNGPHDPTHPVCARMIVAARLATPPATLADTELLMDGELADVKDSGKRLRHSTNVIGRIHVGGLNPVIMGSRRACSSLDSDLNAMAMWRCTHR